jgi:hypothetical protein
MYVYICIYAFAYMYKVYVLLTHMHVSPSPPFPIPPPPPSAYQGGNSFGTCTHPNGGHKDTKEQQAPLDTGLIFSITTRSFLKKKL